MAVWSNFYFVFYTIMVNHRDRNCNECKNVKTELDLNPQQKAKMEPIDYSNHAKIATNLSI